MKSAISLLVLGTAQLASASSWKLVWSDEFDGNQVDRSKWHYDTGNNGWGNNELEYYTDRT